jgi:DNA (cytosine-5)-methyltransferase 1
MMKQLTFGSLFAGVGGFDMGFEQAGWDASFRSSGISIVKTFWKHWPDVPKWGDVSEVDGAFCPLLIVLFLVHRAKICLLLESAPGLEGSRSGLFHEATRIIKEMRYATNGTFPRWAVWENVAGALSSNRGADFATVLHQMGEAGAVEQWWNILDAQFFGVPQRRRRLFLVACWDPATAARCPEALLPVAESLPGHLEKSKPKRKSASRRLQKSVGARLRHCGFVKYL